MNYDLNGWIKEDTTQIVAEMPQPFFMDGVPRGNESVCLYDIYREVAGEDDMGVQEIGDCTGWGFKHLVDYIQCTEIWRQLQSIPSNTPDAESKIIRDQLLYEFQMTSSEVIYALSRVEAGDGSRIRGDGSSGARCARAINRFGTLSYRRLKELGYTDKYSGARARQWGDQGLPDELEPDAFKHIVGTTSLVTKFTDAAHLIENGYGVAVCSNVGFENAGRGSQTLRDAQGFASPKGEWNHCMFLCAVRYDRPGLCCINQYPLQAFAGPLALRQPKNSFWIDERVVDQMLRQGDSWTASGHRGYPLRSMTYAF